MAVPALVLSLLDALDEPAMLVSGQRTIAANGAARALLGQGIVDQDVRFAIRQPQALDAILAGRPGQVEVTGIGGIARSFAVVLTDLGKGLLLVRLVDRSARRAAEKAQIDFVANASHELRTPLAAVLGYSETLADEQPLPEELRRRFGGEIHAQASRMMVIIRDLMSLSRIEADRFREPREEVLLGPIIRDAVAGAESLAEERGCRVDLDLDEALGPVRGDPTQLRQLLDNLLGNAVRYGCRPGEAGRVLVSLGADRGWQKLSVRDWGDGVPTELIPRLTGRFYRIDDTRSRDSGGTGLGLAIVAHIVERHRGLLEIRSSPGQGMEVGVRLPLA